MTAIPCGQKNRPSEISHSQMVTPPLAAMDGTTFRLKTATTNSSTRSRWPRTRLRCGWDSARVASSVSGGLRKKSRAESLCEAAAGSRSYRIPGLVLVAGRRGHQTAFGLCFGQAGRHFFKYREVFVDVRFRVLHG